MQWDAMTAPIAPLIDVQVENGVATLRGKLAFQWQKRLIEQVTQKALGVRKVESRQLTVSAIEN
jgi:osmotically-inducible protein OsmY